MVDPKWDLADSFVGAVMGVIAGIVSLFGWINRRTRAIHARINVTNESVNQNSLSIAALEAHHEANQRFQQRVDQALRDLNKKNDAQLQILTELRGRSHH